MMQQAAKDQSSPKKQSDKGKSTPSSMPTARKVHHPAQVPTHFSRALSPSSSSITSAIIQKKLSIGASNDRYEQEADAVADRVMQMPLSGTQMQGIGVAPQKGIQRKCAACEDEKIQRKPLAISSLVQTKSKGENSGVNAQMDAQIASTRGGGHSMDGQTQIFMENRFGRDFSQVKVHTGGYANQLSQDLNARAFAVGNDIYFNQGQYQPHTTSGKHLLAHELTHTVQQSGGNHQINRKIHKGHDNHGTYAFNDTKCELDYEQNWFFDFQITATEAEKTKLMETAAKQVHDTWSGKFPLIPTPYGTTTSCPCPKGAKVDVKLHPKERKKSGRGISVVVKPKVRANVNPVTGDTELEHNSSSSDFKGSQFKSGLQYTIAHEFGHTIDITDEYNGWMKLFSPKLFKDLKSMMDEGNSIRPRHYQYFADLISLHLNGCRYNPDGVRLPEFENSVNRTSSLAGLTIEQDGLSYPSAIPGPYSLGMNYDLRLSNERILGLFYPKAGMIKLQDPAMLTEPLLPNPSSISPSVGGTIGMGLGHIAYPLVFNLRTGLVTNPANPTANVGIPLNIQVGLRNESFEFGLHYTAIFDILTPGNVSHLFGAGVTF